MNYIISLSFRETKLMLKGDSLEYRDFIHCKKYLLDYGKSSEAIFDYDDLMEISPMKMMGDYINIYLNLCKKYSNSFDFIDIWTIE